MDEKLYNLMDWAGVEALVYSEEDHPEKLLGAHITDDGVLIQVFVPDAKAVTVRIPENDAQYPMEEEDEAGYFAALVPGKEIPVYTLLITNREDAVREEYDPYCFEPQISEKDAKKFNAGICYDIYRKLGAHPVTIKGISGVYFAVWAPFAMRVSVVGDFNQWDGRRYPMRRFQDSGIYELFIPGIKVGALYKFEIKAKGGLTYLKADPYANCAELRPNTASVVADLDSFTWTDQEWMEKRKTANPKESPMFIYEMHLGSWKKPEDGRYFYNYRELAPMAAEYVKGMGYTHIELMPVMEHPLDASWGYQVTGYYAPTSRYGSPQDFMYFMDYMHNQGIGVILDWVPAHFPRDTHGLSAFDGTCLYEHLDPRQGSHPHWGTLIYNYGRPEVRNFLIANALYWKNVYHADGIRMDAVASMLYLDYGKNDGEWVANMYGGHENLEAIDFLKQLNSVFKKDGDGAILIAEESTAWPKITAPVEDGGLGFDFKWNMGWMNDFLSYMQLDPIFRSYHHGELTFSMIYAYSENFILTLSHDEVVHGKSSMIGKMPGKRRLKFANLRAACGYMVMHPGKKLLFMGQDFAQFSEWNEGVQLEWDMLQYDEHKQLNNYIRALAEFYRTHPALYCRDYETIGFEWINSMAADENLLVFMRRGEKQEEDLLVVCNFSPLVYDKHPVGVPYSGKYKEIFNSDSEEFGGSGSVNPRAKASKKIVCDDRENSITIKIPPMGIAVFSCVRTEEEPAKEAVPEETPKKRGRKPAAETKTETVPAEAPKKRGRKPAAETKTETVQAEAPKKRGRKPAAEAKMETVQEEAPKKRGRKKVAETLEKAVGRGRKKKTEEA